MLNVAVIGSGPAGLYAAEALVKQAAALPSPVAVRVDAGRFRPASGPELSTSIVSALTGRLRQVGLSERDVARVFATFNAAAPVFLELHHPGAAPHGKARDDPPR